jgi:hypothetical protein
MQADTGRAVDGHFQMKPYYIEVTSNCFGQLFTQDVDIPWAILTLRFRYFC